MYKAYLEFPEGWGHLRKYPFHGGDMDIFWNYTIMFCVSKIHNNLLHYDLPEMF